MNLVIVESPAKCSKIQGYLGPGFKVIATMGHIRALEESLDAIGLEKDFEPRYTFLDTKAKALKQIKDSAKDATKIYLASDDDREGEAISYSVCAFLRLNPATTPRIVFHEITEKAIKAAVASPRLIDMNRVNAQQSRSMLDMMIGFTMSPLLWKHVAVGLSAGRCQTPALKIVVERENQISSFSAASSWRIAGDWMTGKMPIKGTMYDELEDEESSLNYLEMLQDPATATINSNTVKPWPQGAPQPLITSTLQQQASALYSIPPKSAMQSAQRLYEAGHITYMRTDMAILSEEAKGAIREFVSVTYGSDYLATASTAPKPKKSAKVTDIPKAQEAHECIRPTHIEIQAIPDTFSASDTKIYSLIWQRAVQSQMASAKGETCTVSYSADASPDFQWTSQWRRTTFEGWRVAGKVADIDQESVEAEAVAVAVDSTDSQWTKAITELIAGVKMKWTQLTAEPHETKAPPRYTEATLVRELEKHGIGRPSTFASLIATIQDKNYAEVKNLAGKEIVIQSYIITPGKWPPIATGKKRILGAEKQKLVPTDLGRSALEFMLKHFEDLFEYTFTASMEKRLDIIAEGAEPWKQVLRDTWASYKDRYEALKVTGSSTCMQSSKIREFGEGIKAVISKKGPLILYEPSTKGAKATFYGWPEGVSFQTITKEQVDAFIASRKVENIGEWKGHPIQKKTGRFGPYAQAGDTIASIAITDTLEQICEKLDAKTTTKEPLKKFKEFEIHTGQYGPYIIKQALKQRKFVPIPKGVTIETLTDSEVEALYKAGLEKKSAAKKFAPKSKN